MLDDTPTTRPAQLPAILRAAAEIGFAMSVDERTGALLAVLAASKPGGRILELGTGVGAGAAWIASGMSPSTRLVTVEQDQHPLDVARTWLHDGPRITFEHADADVWLDTYSGEPFDLVFVDCRPGKFHGMSRAVGLLNPGGIYLGDDLLPQPTWPADHQQRVDRFLEHLPGQMGLRSMVLNWASGLVLGVRV